MRDRRVRWLLVVLGVLLALLGVASWVSLHLTSRQTVVFSYSFPPAAAPASHPTYSYRLSCPLGATLLPGKRFARLSLRQRQVIVRWQPTPANFSSETKPTTLTLSADLIGRFDDAKQAEQAMHPGGPRGTVGMGGL